MGYDMDKVVLVSRKLVFTISSSVAFEYACPVHTLVFDNTNEKRLLGDHR